MGAWIETTLALNGFFPLSVAPYMGAWIETKFVSLCISDVMMSHPTWVRGLKLRDSSIVHKLKWSHPTWVRGLKHSTMEEAYEEA